MKSFDLGKICTAFGAAPAIIAGDRSISYHDLGRNVAGTLSRLHGAGVRTGDYAAIWSDNSADMVILLLALMQQGTVAVPVNTRWPAAVTGKVLAGLNCRHLYVSDEFASAAELTGLKMIRIAELAAAGPLPAHPFPDGIPLDNTCDVMFTSGSTGEAKAALHLLQNHYYSALGSNENIHLKAGDRWMISLPLFHAGGLAIVFRCLLSGAAMVLPDEGLSLAETEITMSANVDDKFTAMLNVPIAIEDGEVKVEVEEATLDLKMHYDPATQLAADAQNRVLDLKGKRLSADEIFERLDRKTPVLVSVSGRMPDPFYLQCTKPDTLIVVLGIPSSPAPELLPQPASPPQVD